MRRRCLRRKSLEEKVLEVLEEKVLVKKLEEKLQVLGENEMVKIAALTPKQSANVR